MEFFNDLMIGSGENSGGLFSDKGAIMKIAPLFNYRIILKNENYIEKETIQNINNHIAIKNIKVTLEYYKSYHNEIELYFRIEKTTDNNSNIGLMTFLVLAVVGLSNLNEYTTVDRVEINILPLLEIVTAIIILIVGIIWLR